MLGVDASGVHAQRAPGAARVIDHRPGSADEELAEVRRIEQLARESAYALRVQTAVEQLHLLRFRAHHEVQRESLEVSILQREQLLEQHRAGAASIAVEELHSVPRVLFEK